MAGGELLIPTSILLPALALILLKSNSTSEVAPRALDHALVEAAHFWHVARAVTPKQIDAYCSTLPAATRTVQWEGVIVFKVGGKMFCLIAPPDHSIGRISFKCAPEHYDALSRAEGFRPAPYLARAKWVALDDPKTLTAAQTKAYLRRAHAVIAAALPKKKQAELGLRGP